MILVDLVDVQILKEPHQSHVHLPTSGQTSAFTNCKQNIRFERWRSRLSQGSPTFLKMELKTYSSPSHKPQVQVRKDRNLLISKYESLERIQGFLHVFIVSAFPQLLTAELAALLFHPAAPQLLPRDL
eukprot:768640-Hanusia_phi.AAC.13